MNPYRRTVALGAAALVVLAPIPSAAQRATSDWPSKPIKMIVTYPPGGGNDIIARLMQPKLSEALGQPVVVENRSGAGGTIGTAAAAKSAPDGHTVVMVSPPFVMSNSLYKDTGFDPIKDFAPITTIGAVANVLVVHPSLPAKTLPEFVQYAKAHPGKLNGASLGSATTQNLAAELLKTMAGIDVVMIYYKGSAPGMQDLLAGNVQMMFNSLPSTLPHIKAGKLRALATTGEKRATLLPDLPTIAEFLPGYEVSTWYGFLAPAGTPPAIVNRFNQEIVKIVKSPDIHARLVEMGIEVAPSTPDGFAALIKSEVPRWAKVIKDTGVKAE